MLDFGIWYRKQFLQQELQEKRQKLQAYWLIAIAVIFFGGHIAYYLYKTF
jgi:prolipoprotein diacylglyceryltransferase